MYCVYGVIFGWKFAGYSIIFQFISTHMISAFHHRYDLVTLQATTEKGPEVVALYIKHLDGPGLDKSREKHCSHSDHQAYFLIFFRSFICSSIVFKLLVFPILSRPPATLFVFLTDARRAALPPQKAALSHDQKSTKTDEFYRIIPKKIKGIC